ncbi:MAG: toll/interleukin-1 receptor domain-containing protein, partial [Candidatus Sulfotelmatobacter sp.]
MADPYRYRAFISYSRVDRAQAKLLQSQLERFVLPQAIRIIKPGLRYDSRPLKPIFRDEDELVPGQDLPRRVRLGLERSEYLIVLCSPGAVASEWVNKEILDFVALGGRDRVIAVVVDGEPNVAAQGFAVPKECLPAALRFEVDLIQTGDGRMAAEVSKRAAETLWVDWRNGIHAERTEFLRLVAALLSLASLDELINRDRVYRRRRALFAWMGGTAIAVAILCFSVMLGLQMHREAVKNSNTLLGLAQRAVKDGDWEGSARYALLGMKGAEYPWIGFDARTAEDALAGSLLDNRRIGIPRTLLSSPNSLAVLSNHGTFAAVANKAGTVQVFDTTTTGEPRGTVLEVGAFDGFTLSPDGTLAATHTQSVNNSGAPSEFRIWDVSTGKQVFQTLNYLAPSVMTVTLSFSPDNKKLACVGEFGDGGASATLFDLASGRSSDLAEYFNGISSLAFSPDSTLVAVAWPEGVRIWQTATGKPKTDVMSIASTSVYAQVAISPDDKTLAVGTTESTLIYWDIERHRSVLNENLASGPIASLTFSSSGEWIGVQFGSGLVDVWKASDGSYDLADRAT